MRYSSWIGRSVALLLLRSGNILASSEATGSELEVGTAAWEADVLEQYRAYLDANGGFAALYHQNENGTAEVGLEVGLEVRGIEKRAVPAGTVWANPPSGVTTDPKNPACTGGETIAVNVLFTSATTDISVGGTGANEVFTAFSLTRIGVASPVNAILNPSFETGSLPPWFYTSGIGLATTNNNALQLNGGLFTTIVVAQTLSVVPSVPYLLTFQHTCTIVASAAYVTLTGTTQAPGLLHLVPSTDTGPSNTDGRTNVVDPILAGTGLPLSNIVILRNGNPIGVATTQADGTFIFPFPVLSGTNIITATTFFPATQTSSGLSAPFTVIIDPPLTIFFSPGSDNGVPGDKITTNTLLTFTGTGPINRPLLFTDNGAVLFTTTTSGSGNWVVVVSTTPGVHVFSISDPVNVYPNNPPPTVTVTVANVPNPPSVLAIDASTDTGDTGDFRTADTTPTITGTASTNAAVSLLVNNVQVGNGFADGAGVFSITLTVPLAAGPNNIVGVQTTTLGFVSPQSAPLVVTILLAQPTLTGITDVTDSLPLGDLKTTVLTPSFVGVALPNAQVIILRGGIQEGSAPASAGGSYEVPVSALPGPGVYTFVAKHIFNGFESELSTPLTITITPGPPVLTGIDIGSDSAPVGDDQTSDATPDIVGSGAPGASISLYLGSSLIGFGTANANTGAFAVTTTLLGPPGVYGITARQSVSGIQSELSAPFTITILPEAPILTGVAPSPGLNSNQIPIASSRTPAIEGSALPNANIILFEGNRIAGSGQTGSDGTFSITANTELDLGVHVFTGLAWTFEGLMSTRSDPFSFEVVDPLPSSSSSTVASSTSESSSTVETSSTTVFSSSTTESSSSASESSTSSDFPSSTTEFFSSTTEFSSSATDSSTTADDSNTSDIPSSTTESFSTETETASETDTTIEPSITASISDISITASETFSTDFPSTTQESFSETETDTETETETVSFASETESSSAEPTVTSAETSPASVTAEPTSSEDFSTTSTAADVTGTESTTATEPTETTSVVPASDSSTSVPVSGSVTASNTDVATTSTAEGSVTSPPESSTSSPTDVVSGTVPTASTTADESITQPTTAPTGTVEPGTTTPVSFTSDLVSTSMRFWNSSTTDVSATTSPPVDTTDLTSATATGSPATSSGTATTNQGSTASGSTSGSVPSSTSNSFFLTVQFAPSVKKRQTAGQSYLSLVGDQLIATEACTDSPPVALVIASGRLETVSGSAVTVASAVVASPGYSAVQFDATPDPADIQTTFALTPELSWSNAAFLNSEAQFCLLGNVLQASYTVQVSSIPGCVPVVLIPSTEVCSSASSTVSGTLPPSGVSTSGPIPTVPSIIIGIEITIQITIIYITIEINGNLVHTTTCETQTLTSPLAPVPSTYVDTSVVDGVTKYVTKTVACGVCQHKNAVPGEITVYQVVTVDPSCTTPVYPVVETVKPCAVCKPVVPGTIGGGDNKPPGGPYDKPVPAPPAPAPPAPAPPVQAGPPVQTQTVYPQESGKNGGVATDVPTVPYVDTPTGTGTGSPVMYTGAASTFGPGLAFSLVVIAVLSLVL
ncbi:hypothetical protein ONS96_003802 [Cadophora gregata f. sp. sojae]|nr:hypothetical protein ONS96_003802 [Cadophora gregata f. sp. sojae]